MKKYLVGTVAVVLVFGIFGLGIITSSSVVHADTVCGTTTSISSDTGTAFSDTDKNTSGQAVLTWNGSTLWTTIPNASWIWESYLVQHPDQTETVTFTKNFTISNPIATSSISIAADDTFDIKLNATEIGANDGYSNYSAPQTFDITQALVQGENTLTISVINRAYYIQSDASPYSNPAGLIYSLSLATRNGDPCPSDSPTPSPSPTTSLAPAGSGSSSGTAPQSGGGSFEIFPTNVPISNPASTPQQKIQTITTNSRPIFLASSGYTAPKATSIVAELPTKNIISTSSTSTVSSNLSNQDSGNLAAAASSQNGFSWNLNYVYLLIIIILLVAGYVIWRMSRAD